MICFMFPGQPLALASPLPDDADGAAISAMVRRSTGLDPATGRGDESGAMGQVALQVYGTAVSLYRNRLLRRLGQTPAVVAEHSMGIYPALASVGAIPEEAAVELTCRIGIALSAMARTAAYALGCVIGLHRSSLLALAENNGVFLANQNTSRHFLLAGEAYRIESALAEALASGAFSVRVFPCDAPLHTPLIGAVLPALESIVGEYRFREPEVRLMEHIGQDYLTAADIPTFLVEELCRPVNWEATFLALRRLGVTAFTEVGVGDALKKYNRWIAGENQ